MEKVENDVVELGQASVETKGGREGSLDSAFTLQKVNGLSDD